MKLEVNFNIDLCLIVNLFMYFGFVGFGVCGNFKKLFNLFNFLEGILVK